jgi:hypothetical protein
VCGDAATVVDPAGVAVGGKFGATIVHRVSVESDGQLPYTVAPLLYAPSKAHGPSAGSGMVGYDVEGADYVQTMFMGVGNILQRKEN